MAAKKLLKGNYMTLVESKVVGHYRGEDSGAIYPEFDYDVVEAYDLNPIENEKIGNQTIEELIEESIERYPYAGELFTSPQAHEIYNYLNSSGCLEKYKISI